MEFVIKTQFEASAELIYKAWLNSEKHSKMTGGIALISDKRDDLFTAWDGYISGCNRILVPFSLIEQTWRTSEFETDDEDSIIEIRLKEEKDTTILTLIHTNLPNDGLKYKVGWEEYYFEPMREYFK